MNEKVENVKWADYLISAVRYKQGSENRIIELFKVHEDEISLVGGSKTWFKDEVIEAFLEGKTLATIKKNSEGKWIKGQDVYISTYLTTVVHSVEKKIPGDYLENLPDF